METAILLLWLAFWGFTIYYCRKVAARLGYNKDVALLVSFFLPIPALPLYFYYSLKNEPNS